MAINSDELLRDVLFATLKEQRAKRRWGIFFKSAFLLIVLLMIAAIWAPDSGELTASEKSPHTALVKVDGIIAANSRANAESIIDSLDDAFKAPGTKGVILQIDSPGGSPVQASEVYNEIMRLRAEHPKIKIYTVCSDVCTSAAYYMASATNNIYANPASLVGSIGVLIESFGVTGAMDKLGIQRRLFISGIHKGFLDPFSPLNAQDQAFAQTLLDQVHQQFISAVLKGRGNRLKVDQNTFSGLAWTGQQALPQGLIDGFGSSVDVARNVIKAKHIIDYTVKPNLFDQLASRFGASFATQLATTFGFNDGIRAQT